MPKKIFTPEQIKKITGASHHEPITVPFYYAPPFLDRVREHLQSRMASSGGRPTIKDAEIQRKVRFSKKDWEDLGLIAKSFKKKSRISISPAQVAGSILEETLSAYRVQKKKAVKKIKRLASG